MYYNNNYFSCKNILKYFLKNLFFILIHQRCQESIITPPLLLLFLNAFPVQ
jgi:uncharacterized phage infection (PIP) family protein YhgE